MERKAFMCDMILTELEDVVGVENVSTSKSDRAAYGVDYFWIGRMWVDRGEKPPHARLDRPAGKQRGSIQNPENCQLL